MRLLINVKNLDGAMRAIQGGADIIDVETSNPKSLGSQLIAKLG